MKLESLQNTGFNMQQVDLNSHSDEVGIQTDEVGIQMQIKPNSMNYLIDHAPDLILSSCLYLSIIEVSNLRCVCKGLKKIIDSSKGFKSFKTFFNSLHTKTSITENCKLQLLHLPFLKIGVGIKSIIEKTRELRSIEESNKNQHKNLSASHNVDMMVPANISSRTIQTEIKLDIADIKLFPQLGPTKIVQNTQESPIFLLSNELFKKVFSYLPVLEILKLPPVCRKFDEIINSGSFWMHFNPDLKKTFNRFTHAKINKFTVILFIKHQLEIASNPYIVCTTKDKIMDHIYQPLLNNNDFVSRLFEKSICIFEYIPDFLKTDKKTLLAASKHDPIKFNALGEDVKNNKEIVKKNLTSWANSKYYVDEEIIKSFSQELKNDEEIMLLAIQCNPKNYKYAGINLRNNKDFAFKSMNLFNHEDGNDKCPLRHFSKEFKNDEQIVRLHMPKFINDLEFVGSKLKKNINFALSMLRENSKAWYHLHKYHRTNKAVVLLAAEYGTYRIHRTYKEFIDDDEVVLKVVSQHGHELQYASKRLQEDKDVVLAALKNDRRGAIRFVPESLMNDPDVKQAMGVKKRKNDEKKESIDSEVEIKKRKK